MGQGNQRDFGGNVLRYGVGLGYVLFDDSRYTVAPVSELVGWQVLDGLKSDLAGQRIPADGDSIVNLKLGLRLGMYQCSRQCRPADTLFVGYGTSLTSDRWYSDILRVEMRWTF